MFRPQASALRTQFAGADAAQLRGELENFAGDLFQLLTGCGALDHDTDGQSFDLTGHSPNTAGVSGDHAILDVRQLNQNAGSTSNPYLYAARFEGPVKFTEPPQTTFVVTTTAKWTDGTPPTVAATHADLGAITVRLNNTSTQDPNVRSGETILITRGDDNNYYALDSQLDGKVGKSVLPWYGAVASIATDRPGWQLADGTNGSPNLVDRFLVGAGSTYSLGATGGATAHSHTISGTSDNNSVYTITMGGSVAAGGDHDHTAVTGGQALTTNAGGTGNTSYSVTNLTVDNYAGGTTGGSGTLTTNSGGTGNTSTVTLTWNTATCAAGADNEVLSDPDGGTYGTGEWSHDHFHTGPSHTHDIASHTHSGPSHTHTLTEDTTIGGAHDPGHRHTGPSHTHTIDSHTHSITTSGTHQHSATGLTATPANHTHGAGSYTAASAANNSLPPYYALAFIYRVD